MNEHSGHPTRRNLFRLCLWLAVAALVIGVATTCWQLAVFKVGDVSAFETLNVLRSILIDSAIALVGLAAVVLVFKWLVRLVRWFFTWRILKRFLLTLAGLVALLFFLGFLFSVEENWRGKRAWENYRREWDAKGEHFDFAFFIPPPVPDEQNFALTPIVVSGYVDRYGHPVDVEPSDTNAVNRLRMAIVRQRVRANNRMELGSW